MRPTQGVSAHPSKRSAKFNSLASALILMSSVIQLTSTASTPCSKGIEVAPSQSTLTADYWQNQDLDRYLRTYPNGNILSLPEYVDQLQLPQPFDCGVGKQCRISPLGVSLQGPDWYILYATSVWNHYANSLVHALNNSSLLSQSVVHHMLRDLVHEFKPESDLGVITEVDLIRLLLYPIEHGGNPKDSLSIKTQVPDWMAAIKPISDTPLPSHAHTAMDLPKQEESMRFKRTKRQVLTKPSTPMLNVPLIIYNSTQPVETNLEVLSTQMHHMLGLSIENKINSPISLDTGIYSALEGGRFLSAHIEPAHLAPNAKDIMALIGISAILNHQNAMVLVRKSSCSKYRHELGKNKSRLAFCASDETLIEIVDVNDNTIVKDIYNAHLIKDKYGFKTSFLASEALRCQESKRAPDSSQHDSGENQSFDICTFDLPVCNLTEEYYDEILKDGKSIARICREDVGLPI